MSLITCAWQATNATTYGSTRTGARAMVARTAVSSRPARSATPTAIIISSTVPSGGKPVKLTSAFSSSQLIPAPEKSPFTSRRSSVPGTVTSAPVAARTVETTPSTRKRTVKR